MFFIDQKAALFVLLRLLPQQMISCLLVSMRIWKRLCMRIFCIISETMHKFPENRPRFQGFKKEPEKAESFTVQDNILLHKEQRVVQKVVTDINAFWCFSYWSTVLLKLDTAPNFLGGWRQAHSRLRPRRVFLVVMSPLRRHLFVCFMAKSAFWGVSSALAP